MSVLPTSIDMIHATAYALNKIKNDKCNDSELLDKYPGMKWEINNELRPYYCPNSLNCDYGSCKVKTEELCKKIRGDFDNSQKPYCESDENCDSDNKCVKNKCVSKHPYLEWRNSLRQKKFLKM